MKTKLQIAEKNLNNKTQASWYINNDTVSLHSAYRSEGCDYDVAIEDNKYVVRATGLTMQFTNVKDLCSQLRLWLAEDLA